jgi:alpha-tubulin suppressor-like RCC1 family protein
MSTVKAINFSHPSRQNPNITLDVGGNLSTNTVTCNAAAVNSITSNVAISSARLNNVTLLTKTGYNHFMLLHNGILYSAAGNNSGYSSYCLGRGTSYPNQVGLDSMRALTFPAETGNSSYIVDAGTHGYMVAYALFSNGNLYTWGYNNHGQCGVGSTSFIYNPTLAATNVTNVYSHPSNGGYSLSSKMVIRKSDGYLYTAGYNGYGQLGVGDTTNRSSFTQLTSLGTNILSVWNMGADYGALYVQKTDLTIWACGYNGYGQLGDASTTSRSSLVNVTTNWSGGTRYIQRVIGGYGYYNGGSASWTGMIFTDGTVKLAGYGGDGAMGNGSTSNQSTPVSPTLSGTFTDIAGFSEGLGSVWALRNDGNVYAWGRNGYGQLGNGNTTQQNSPVLITTGGLELMADFSCNYIYGYYACSFLRKSDGLYTAGYNGNGSLGVGDTTDRSSLTRVLLPQNFVVSKMGWFATTNPVLTVVALSTDGRLYAWGYNGQYAITAEGYNNTVTSPVMVKLPLGG